MDSTVGRNHAKHKVNVIMGARHREIQTHHPPRDTPSAEIFNSGKIQVYRVLDIATNKIQIHERLCVPYHLLRDIDASHSDLIPSQVRSVAATATSDMSSSTKLRSNSLFHALRMDKFDS